jgi:hypothetical protein
MLVTKLSVLRNVFDELLVVDETVSIFITSFDHFLNDCTVDRQIAF